MLFTVSGKFLGVRDFVDKNGNTRFSVELAVESSEDFQVPESMVSEFRQFAVGSPITLRLTERRFPSGSVLRTVVDVD